MASLATSLYHRMADPFNQISFASVALVIFVLVWFVLSYTELSLFRKAGHALSHYGQFAYSCFLKPHSGDGTGSQQDALESFYKSQASVYDATRMRLLQGREDMLALVAAQSKYRRDTGQMREKPVWVDIGGGTGWNIEQMQQQLDVPTFFHAVYLVDLSTSLCEIARKRFERLGWSNVHVVCQDARTFRLSDYEAGVDEEKRDFSIGRSAYDEDAHDSVGADVLTMSYSLSMIPEFHPAVDSVANLLAPDGIVGIVDFYVQNKIEFCNRNYTGGAIDRHCMWISRVFWRTWFELDRVNLDSARRDYIEYKFGTILSTNRRCRFLGFRIPYYIFVGCPRRTSRMLDEVAQLDAAVTESPFISALDLHARRRAAQDPATPPAEDRHSKAYDTAIVNLTASLPLPAAYYQNQKTRIYYDETLPQHRQFGNEYIYAFTWEDSRADARILNITPEDKILAITSAGDNILSYALANPKRLHAVDLNPAQNHLLELKVAAFRSLPYKDVWRLFGEGKHDDFHSLLLDRLSPYLSTQAFDYWLHVGPATFAPTGKGLYFTGGSRHALNLVAVLGRILGISSDLRKLCSAKTLGEQREVWEKRVRRVLLSRLLAYFVVGSERFLWKALGVPGAQRAMIEEDFEGGGGVEGEGESEKSGQAIWNYGVQTLDPVAKETLLSEENHYYLLCLLGHYTPASHPTYLDAAAHTHLSRPTTATAANPLANLRIHTDTLTEVLTRLQPGALTIAVLMDSMDWFPRPATKKFSATSASSVAAAEGTEQALKQCQLLHRALSKGGRVLLRSAGLWPWYLQVFEDVGFACTRVAVRGEGSVRGDRVNMYASTWVCVRQG